MQNTKKSFLNILLLQTVLSFMLLIPMHMGQAHTGHQAIHKINSYLYDGDELNISTKDLIREVNQDQFRKLTIRAQAISEDSTLTININNKEIQKIQLEDKMTDFEIVIDQSVIKEIKLNADAAFVRMAKFKI